MPIGSWQRGTIGDLVTLQRGIDLPEGERSTGSVPIMGSFGITGFHNVSACRGPGVTVGRSGASIGVVNYICDNYWPLNTCLYVKNFHGNNPRFVYYFLSRQSRNQTGGRRQDSCSAVRAILDDPPIHIRPVWGRKRGCEGQEPCGFNAFQHAHGCTPPRPRPQDSSHVLSRVSS